MTRLIYLETPDLLECEVRVLSCEPHPEGAVLRLDQTPFYPEGGGQPSDTGFIGSSAVTLVVTNDQKEVLHIVDKPLPLGTQKARVDRDRRLDHTQQHAAQHLLSACLMKLCGANTVGFHMSEAYTSIDLDQKIDKETLEGAVLMANEAVRQALPIEALFPDEAALEALPLRKIPKVEDNIRVIKIGDLDYSPCGGTHPDSTAGIGCVMITRSENYKSGTRIEFLAGERAVRDALKKNADLTSLSQSLATPVSDLVAGVEKLLSSQAKLEKALRQSRTALLDFEAAHLADALRSADQQQLIRILDEKEMGELRTLAASALKAVPSGILILASKSSDGNQAQLLCARGEALGQLDIREVFKPAIAILEGRGGGNPATAQGGGPKAEKLSDALAAAEEVLRSLTQV